MQREIQISIRKQNQASPYHNVYETNKMSSTKYSWWSFLPLTLFQQLKNIINLFFIINGLLQHIPSISTNSPLVSLIPVSFVIILGIIFELIQDVRRWLSDNEVNAQQVQKVVDDGDKKLKNNQQLAESLKVGDVI